MRLRQPISARDGTSLNCHYGVKLPVIVADFPLPGFSHMEWKWARVRLGAHVQAHTQKRTRSPTHGHGVFPILHYYLEVYVAKYSTQVPFVPCSVFQAGLRQGRGSTE